MLNLQVFGAAFGLPDPSPFAMKGQMLLKLSGLEFTIERGDVQKAPKGKFPVLIDGERKIPDSTFIRLHLENEYGIDFDPGLSPHKKGIAWATEKMLEDSLYWAIMYERWMIDENFDRGPRTFFNEIPILLRAPLTAFVRRQVKRNLWGHGMSRHSRTEILELSSRVFTSLSAIMGDNKYLMGDKPCGADATVFSFVAVALCPIFDSEILDQARSHANLLDYNQRMMEQFFPELAKG